MDVEAYRDLQLLTEICLDESVTQRSLAKRYRLALGLTNFLMRRLVRKGYVKIVNLERKRLRYLITPQGLAEKARLTYEYLDYSLYFYRQIRTFLSRALTVIVQSGEKKTILYGAGEVAELAFLALQQHGVTIVGVLDDEVSVRSSFMGQPVRSFMELATLSWDWLVVASLKDDRHIIQQLSRWGIPEEKIITISHGGRSSPLVGAKAEALLETSMGILETPT